MSAHAAPTSTSHTLVRPPGPPPGNGGPVGQLRFLHGMLTDAIGTVGRRFERYGDVYYVPNKDGGLYVLRHPEHLREVLMSKASKFDKSHTAMQKLGEILGHGLLTTDGDRWRRHRRMVQPAFTRQAMSSYGRVMTQEAVRTAQAMRDGEQRDLSREMTDLTLRVVSRTLFSHDIRGETDDTALAMRVFNARVGRPDLAPAWLPTPGRRRMARAVATLDRTIYGLIDERERGLDQAPDDLLQRLVTAVDDVGVGGDGGGLSRVEVRDHLLTLFLAGHETTSHALTWTWSLLADRPEVEARLDKELQRALGGRDPQLEDLEALPYTRQVLEESMRLFPPAYVLSRRAIEDVEVGGWTVPAGSEVVCWIAHVHRDPRWWPAPHAFRPERFADGADEGRPKLAWMPFGAGARACIGARFAMVEAQLILATLAQRFRFRRIGDAPPKPSTGVTLSPKGGLPMRVIAR